MAKVFLDIVIFHLCKGHPREPVAPIFNVFFVYFFFEGGAVSLTLHEIYLEIEIYITLLQLSR